MVRRGSEDARGHGGQAQWQTPRASSRLLSGCGQATMRIVQLIERREGRTVHEEQLDLSVNTRT